MNFIELVLPFILFGILWGALYFHDFDELIKKVLANPENYSRFTIALFRKLTLFPKLVLSFFTAVIFVPLIGIVIMTALYLLGFDQ